MNRVNISLGDVTRSGRVMLCHTIACRTVSVGLDGCGRVYSSLAIAVDWHACACSAGTGEGGAPVRDVPCEEQAMSVGLDGCESVPSWWSAMAAE